MKKLLSVVAVSAITTTLFANPGRVQITGHYFADRCAQTLKMYDRQPYNHSKASWCIGYVNGLMNSHVFFSYKNIRDKKIDISKFSKEDMVNTLEKHQMFCIPKTVSGRKIIDNTLDYMNAHKTEMKYPAVLLVYHAWYNKFPCKQHESNQRTEKPNIHYDSRFETTHP